MAISFRMQFKPHLTKGDSARLDKNLRRLLIKILLSPPFIICLLAITLRILPGARTVDDAYITFRYARNILSGNGFVFNPGEPILGTTTPLYTLILSTLGAMTGGSQAPLPQIALVVNAFADAITCWLLTRLGQHFGSTRAGLGAALLWAIAPFSVTFAIGGLETSLYVLFLIATTVAYLKRRFSRASLLAAFAFLTRPDALILLAPLVLDYLADIMKAKREPGGHRSSDSSVEARLSEMPMRNYGFFRRMIRNPTFPALLFLLAVLPWLLFSSLYFGSPIPQSVAAKSLAYRLPPEAALIRMIQHYATPFHDDLTLGRVGIGFGIILYPFLYLVGAMKAWRTNRRTWAFLVYPWMYFMTFSIANPLIFRWYLTPPLPGYFLVIILGAEQMITSLITRRTNNKKETTSKRISYLRTRLLPSLFIIWLPFLMMLKAWQIRPDHGLDRPAPAMAWYQLELLYKQAAEILSPQLTENSRLAAGDVGVLGYYTPAYILDTVGLNSPQTLRYYPLDPRLYAINYAVAPELILSELPDFVVILEVYGRLGLIMDERFQAQYKLVEKIPTDIYGSDGLLLFSHTRVTEQ